MIVYVNGLAALVILLWAVWCIAVRGVVREGIVGQCLFGFLALSAFGVMVAAFDGRYSQPGESGVIIGYAGLAIRHWWLKNGAAWNRRRHHDDDQDQPGRD